MDDMILLGIDGKDWVGKHYPALYCKVTKTPPDIINRLLKPLLLLRPRHIRENGELHTVDKHQIRRPHSQAAYRQSTFMMLLIEAKGCVKQLLSDTAWPL